MRLNVKIDSFAYERAKIVLDNVHFEVEDKEIVGVLGRSGCGKSTLLRIICGLISSQTHKYFSGEIKINGSNKLRQFRSTGKIGFMFQEPSLLPNLTVKENIKFPLRIFKQNKNEEFLYELINIVGLEKYKNYLPSQLSGGMQTRVALARTFVTKPELLILDEPFSSLDYGWKLDLYNRLTQLIKKFGSTTIIVSHDINEILLLSNKLILISQFGQVIKNIILRNQKLSFFEPDGITRYLESVKAELLELQQEIANDMRG